MKKVNKEFLYIVIDFDGTYVTHDFPRVGKDIGAAPVLKELVAKGHKLILFTMRDDHDFEPSSEDADIVAEKGNYLTDALKWFEKNDIPLFGVQTNPTQKGWTGSPKAFGHVIIDDAALGCPLMIDFHLSTNPFVDWGKVREWFVILGALP